MCVMQVFDMCLYRPIVEKAIEIFRPGAIVLQCGVRPIHSAVIGQCNRLKVHHVVKAG
jgi:acetoin utilization deacetylase AcuC-like enzyme